MRLIVSLFFFLGWFLLYLSDPDQEFFMIQELRFFSFVGIRDYSEIEGQRGEVVEIMMLEFRY